MEDDTSSAEEIAQKPDEGSAKWTVQQKVALKAPLHMKTGDSFHPSALFSRLTIDFGL